MSKRAKVKDELNEDFVNRKLFKKSKVKSSTSSKKENVMVSEEEDDDIDIAQPCSSLTIKKENTLFKKINNMYWDFDNEKEIYKKLTGKEFVPVPLEETKFQNWFSEYKEQEGRSIHESDLFQDGTSCVGCGSRIRSEFNMQQMLCHSCTSLSYDDNRHNRKEKPMCSGPPQLKNECIPFWSPTTKLFPCFRCKLDRIGLTDNIDPTPKVAAAKVGGFGYFQVLKEINLLNLFTVDNTATSGAVIVRLMNFSVFATRVLANIVLTFRRDDPKIQNVYFIQQLAYAEASRKNSVTTLKRDSDDIVGLVKVENNLIEFDINENWTSVAA